MRVSFTQAQGPSVTACLMPCAHKALSPMLQGSGAALTVSNGSLNSRRGRLSDNTCRKQSTRPGRRAT